MARLALIALTLLLLAAPATAAAETELKRDIEIRMSDGVILRGDLRRPANAGPLPTVIIKFEYNKDEPSRPERDNAEEFAKAGFAALIVDSRGTGASEGPYCFLCLRDQQDGYDVVEWAARQPWSDGNIGMFGYSEPGVEAALTAITQPPHLKAIVPAAAYSDGYRDIAYPGGIAASVDGVALGALFGLEVPNKRLNADTDPALTPNLIQSMLQQRGNVIVDGLRRDTYDEWWQERSFLDRVDRVQVPALHISAWDDVYPRAAHRNYLAAPERNALLMGPWGHLGGPGSAAGALIQEAATAWFDIHLRTPPGPAREAKLHAFPRVMVFDRDASQPAFDNRARDTGTWRRLGSWLPVHDQQTLNLCADPATPPSGGWALERSLTGGACGEPGSVPIAPLPVEMTGGTSIAHDAGGLGGFDDSSLHDAPDQRANAAATAFVGPALERDVTITGPAEVRLTGQTAGTDADWVARLVDVGPDEARLVGRGWLRASHREEDKSKPYLRHTHTNPQPVEPGVPYPLAIEIWPMSYKIPAGHRLAVLLNASDTQKVRPSGASGPSEVVVGPQSPATVSIPIRTEAGERIADPKAAYAAATRAAAPATTQPACVRRRAVTIHARLRRGQRIRRASVRAGGRRVRAQRVRVRGRTLTARLDLRRFRSRTVRVTITLRSSHGKRTIVRRRVRICRPT